MQCVLKTKHIKRRTFNDKNRWIIKKVMVFKKLLQHLATRGTNSPGDWRCNEAWREQSLVYPPVMFQQRLIYCPWELNVMLEFHVDIGEIAINSIPYVPIWDSEPVTVDFTLSEFDKSSTSSTVFKSRFNEVKQKYLDFCHIYTDGSKVETKVASAYVCPYGTRGYRLRDGCSIFTAEVEAINKALTYVKVSTRKSFVIFSDSMSVLQAIESQESKNPLVNRVLQACQKILSNGKFITFCLLPSHRDIRGNEDADRAAKDALSKAQPENF